jgi:actin-like ATPase involved in cell morphogenesis
VGGTTGYGLGIDIGTTYTAAAVARDGRADIVSLGTRAAVVPSVVFVTEDGRFLTGEAAEARAVDDASRVARGFKRRLGDSTPMLVGGTPCSAESLYAAMVRDVVALVTEREGGPPDAITLTHPANWGPFKLDLLQQAARLAGLDAVSFLREPDAAATQYASMQRLEDGEIVAVYDFGGGTFDAAVLQRRGDGFVVRGEPEGIERLGGIDIDEAVFGHVRDVIGPQLDALDADDDGVRRALVRLREECTLAKERLSTDTDVSINVLLPNVSTTIRLTRAELEAGVRPALTATVESLQRSIASSGLQVGDIDRVLLVGGSSRVPLVAQLVVGELGRPVTIDADPKHVVALGAARHAAGEPAAPPDVPPPPVHEAQLPHAPAPSRGGRRAVLAVALVVVVLVAAGIAAIARRGDGKDKASSGSPTTATTATTAPPVSLPDIERAGALEGLTAFAPVAAETNEEISKLYAQAAGTDPTVAAPDAAIRAYQAVGLSVLASRAAGTDGSNAGPFVTQVAGPGRDCPTITACSTAPLPDPAAHIPLGTPTEAVVLEPRVYNSANRAVADQSRGIARPEAHGLVDGPGKPGTRGGDGTLVIGLLPPTGSKDGDPDRLGAQIAIDEANALGGFGDRPAQLLVGAPPSTDTPDDVRDAANALVADGVDVIVATGPGTIGFVTEVTSQGVLVFATGDGDPSITQVGAASVTFQLAPTLLNEADVLVARITGGSSSAAGQVTLLAGSAPASFIDRVGSALEAKGVSLRRIEVDPAATTYEDIAQEVAAAKPETLVILTGDESPAVFAWLLHEGVELTALSTFGWTGNVNDAMGKAFTDGAAFAPAVS